MPYKSPHQVLSLPQCNILDYIFPDTGKLSTQPLWLDAANPSKCLSLRDMYSLVCRLAAGFDNVPFSLPEGSAVMVFSPNHIYVPLIYFAAAGSRRIFTGANPAYTTDEIVYQMKAISAGLVLIHPDLMDTGLAAAQRAGIDKSRVFVFADEPINNHASGVKDWRNILASDTGPTYAWPRLSPTEARETVACINFSSGTTGLPKGVCVSHTNLIANTAQVIFNKFYNTSRSESSPGSETWLAFLPLYHAYSQLWTINIAARLGYTVYVQSKFVFPDFLSYIQKYKVTAIQAVPPVLVMLSKRPEVQRYDLRSLKHILVGAAPTSSDLQNEVSRRFNLSVAQGWGMTETTCAGIMAPFSTPDDGSGNIGALLPNTEARLVDDAGVEVTAQNEPGELCLRGPQIMLGYWRNPAATADSIDADHWFKTGDVAVVRDGKWWIVDRKKELIKVKGLQVAPAELEAVLLESPDVADAAVVGIRFEKDGEEWPRAYVVLQPEAKGRNVGEREVRKWVESKTSRHKWLQGGVKFVDEIPKLASGKIVRKRMREWATRDAEEIKRTGRAKL